MNKVRKFVKLEDEKKGFGNQKSTFITEATKKRIKRDINRKRTR